VAARKGCATFQFCNEPKRIVATNQRAEPKATLTERKVVASYRAEPKARRDRRRGWGPAAK